MTQVSLPRSARGSAAPAPAAGRPERTGYFASHWRGEQSLVRSYWINNILVASPLAFVLTGLMAWISAKGDSLQVIAASGFRSGHFADFNDGERFRRRNSAIGTRFACRTRHGRASGRVGAACRCVPGPAARRWLCIAHTACTQRARGGRRGRRAAGSPWRGSRSASTRRRRRSRSRGRPRRAPSSRGAARRRGVRARRCAMRAGDRFGGGQWPP